jgi:protein-disulfide isomerase
MLINSFLIPSLKKSSKAQIEKKSPTVINLPINKSNYIKDGEDYRVGSDSAKIIVQMFSDYGCIHCKNATDAILEAQKTFGMDKVLFVYRFFPISNSCNPNIQHPGFFESTCLLSIATRCAGQQKHFFEFRKWASNGITMSESEKKKNLTKEGILHFARKLGLDIEAFKDCLKSKDELSKIQSDANRAQELNIEGTPMIIINGHIYEGSNSTIAFLDYFKSLQN